MSLLRKQGFDKTGLIYGMGHAVYSLSDPRAKLLGQFVKGLSEEKGRQKEYALYSMVERLAPEVISKKSAEFIRVLVPMLIFTVALFIVCWIYRQSCTLHCLQLHVLQAGVLTE